MPERGLRGFILNKLEQMTHQTLVESDGLTFRAPLHSLWYLFAEWGRIWTGGTDRGNGWVAFERNGPRPGSKKQRTAASGGRAALQRAGPAAGRAKASDVECSMALLRGAGCTAQWQGSDVALSGQPGPEHPAGANSGTNAGFHSLLRAAAGTAWPGGDRAARRVQDRLPPH